MKDKTEEEINNQIDESSEEQYDYDDQEIDTSSPEVASGKGSKFALIAFSAILIAVVIYLLFLSDDSTQTSDDDLSPVPTSDFSTTPPAPQIELENFDDAFQGDDQIQEEVILKTPEVPSVPELPDIFSQEDAALPAFLDLPDESNNQQLPLPNANKNNSVPSISNIVNTNNKNQKGEQSDATKPAGPPPIIVVSGGPGPTSSIGYKDNIIKLNKDPIHDLAVREPTISAQYIKNRETTLIQGKIITAILETAINTEIPGDVRGIISRDVYAESGTNILIPKGSRIFGSYSGTIVRGQARVTINWIRLIRPDGVDATISMQAADQFGRAGIDGDVDNKYREIITTSLLTSVLAVGGALAAESLSGDDTSTTTTDPSTGTTTTSGNASSQSIADVSKTIVDTVGEIVGNTVNLNPIIRIPQGTKVTILVNSDMSLPQFKK